jgi:thioredoxin 1
MRIFAAIFNHKAYPLFSALLLGGLIFALARNGITGIDILIVVLYLLGAFGLWRWLVTSQTEEMTSVEKVMQQIQTANRPTIIEFYSRYCMGCMAMKPVVDRLESDAGDRLQIVRLNIDEDPGKTLMSKYGVIFTPTFIHFDAQGQKTAESIGILDRARILYEIERAS